MNWKSLVLALSLSLAGCAYANSFKGTAQNRNVVTKMGHTGRESVILRIDEEGLGRGFCTHDASDAFTIELPYGAVLETDWETMTPSQAEAYCQSAMWTCPEATAEVLRECTWLLTEAGVREMNPRVRGEE